MEPAGCQTLSGNTPPESEPGGRRLVFICGLHRSGTSLLARALAVHPQISGFSATGVPEDEGQHLQSVYPPALTFGGPGRFGFDRRSFMDERHPLCTAANASRLWAQWARYWDANRPVWLEKSPPNLVRTRFLQGLFPQARFVVITRHPATNALATYGKFRPSAQDDVGQLLRHWAVCHARYLADRLRLRSVHEVRYEALMTDPAGVLASVFEFLDLPPLPAPAVTPDPSRDAVYRQAWHQAARSSPGLARFRVRYGRIVRRMGYRLSAL